MCRRRRRQSLGICFVRRKYELLLKVKINKSGKGRKMGFFGILFRRLGRKSSEQTGSVELWKRLDIFTM